MRVDLYRVNFEIEKPKIFASLAFPYLDNPQSPSNLLVLLTNW